MRLWQTAPVFGLALRQSLSWSNLVPAVVVMVAAVLWRAEFGASFPGLVGVFLLVYAVPYAVTLVIAMDRDQRLDHLRLSALTPARLGATLLAGAAGPWLLIGGLLVGVWRADAPLAIDRAAMLSAIIAVSIAVSLVAFGLPRGQGSFDMRLVAVGIAAVMMLAALILVEPGRFRGIDASFLGPFLPGAAGEFDARPVPPAWPAWVVAAAAAAVAIGARRTMRAIARPAMGRMRWTGRLPFVAAIARRLASGFHRGLLLGATSAALLTLLAFVSLVAIKRTLGNLDRDDVWFISSLVTYIPVVAGTIAISTTTLADRTSGRADLVRLSPLRLNVVQHVAGLWCSYVAATALLSLTFFALWGTLPVSAAQVMLTVAVLAPVPILEGWYRRLPLIYVAPALFFVGQLIMRRALIAPDGTGLLQSRTGVIVAGWSWVAWVALARAMRSPDRPPLGGWAAAALGAVIAVPGAFGLVRDATGPVGSISICCFASALLVVSAPLIVDQSPVGRLDRWGPVAAMSLLLVPAWLGANRGMTGAIATIVIVAASWWTAVRIQQRLGDLTGWSLLARVMLAFALPMAAAAIEVEVPKLLSIADARDAMRGAAPLLNGVTAAVVVAACLVFAAALTIRPWIARVRVGRERGLS